MPTYKRWILFFSLPLLIVVTINFFIDPNGVFGIIAMDGINAIKTSIQSPMLTKFYYANRFKPNTIMLGTSRMRALNPKEVEKYVKNKTYNLAFGDSSIYEQYCYFKYMAEHHEIKTAVIGLDLFSFDHTKKNNIGFNERRFDSFFIKDYIDSLLSWNAFTNSIETVKKNMKIDSSIYENYNTGGDVLVQGYQNALENSVKTLKGHANIYTRAAFQDPILVAKSMEPLKWIVKIASEKKIDLKLYISPVHSSYFDLIYSLNAGPSFEGWQRELSKITDFYDFSGHNTISTDINWWFDSHHILTKGGELIFARIFNNPDITVPVDFGTYVTSSNIESHLASLRKHVKKINLQEILN